MDNTRPLEGSMEPLPLLHGREDALLPRPALVLATVLFFVVAAIGFVVVILVATGVAGWFLVRHTADRGRTYLTERFR